MPIPKLRMFSSLALAVVLLAFTGSIALAQDTTAAAARAPSPADRK